MGPGSAVEVPFHSHDPEGIELLATLVRGDEDELRVSYAIVNGEQGRKLVFGLGLPGRRDDHKDVLIRTLTKAGVPSDLGDESLIFSYGGAFLYFSEGRLGTEGRSDSLAAGIPSPIAARIEAFLQQRVEVDE